MIFIVTSSAPEAAAIADLCDRNSWASQACASLEAFENVVEVRSGDIVIVRTRLADAFSEEVIAATRSIHGAASVRFLVLAPASCAASQEARQLNLGADCVLRDPVRPEVLVALVAKLQKADSQVAPAHEEPGFDFAVAGARVDPLQYRISHGSRFAHVSPREVALLRMLARSPDRVLSYARLYPVIFGRRFDGNTVNARVLLGKTTASLRKLGLDLRQHLAVIPKSGYLYSSSAVRDFSLGAAAPKH